MTETYLTAVDEAELNGRTPVGVVLNGWPIALCKTDKGVSAFINRCSHAASEFTTGRIRNGAVMCPLHGAQFEVATGRCPSGAYLPLKIFVTRVVDGKVEVLVPDTAPGPEHRPVVVPG